MSKIFSCGEIKNMKLVFNKDKHDKKIKSTHIDKKRELVFEVNNRKTKNKLEKQEGEKVEVKMATGCKVLKIESAKDLKEIISKYHSDPEKAINAKTTGPNELLENISKDYQGMYVSKEVIEKNPELRSITGDKAGVRVLDMSAIRLADDKNPKPFRKGMNGSKNNLSIQAKKLDNEAYKLRKQLEKNDSTLKISTKIAEKKTLSQPQINKEVERYGKILSVKGNVITLGLVDDNKNSVINLNYEQINNMKAAGELISGKNISTRQAVEARIAYQKAFEATDKTRLINSTDKLVAAIKNSNGGVNNALTTFNKEYSQLVKQSASNAIEKIGGNSNYEDRIIEHGSIEHANIIMSGMVACLVHNNKRTTDTTTTLGRMPMKYLLNAPAKQLNAPEKQLNTQKNQKQDSNKTTDVRQQNMEIFKNQIMRKREGIIPVYTGKRR